MKFEEWQAAVPGAIRQDPLWKVKAYRLAPFLADLAWADATKLLGDRRTAAIADQLYRATGNISSNIAEGYSKGTGRDRARFCEYSLGSTREARDWYYKGRHVLGDAVTEHRIGLSSDIIRLTITMISDDRRNNRRI